MFRIVVSAFFVSLLLGLLAAAPAREKTAEANDKLYELRVYTTNDGKLDALNARFRNHTNKLFQKHGMELVAYWTPSETSKGFGWEPDNTLVYVLAYPSKEARDKSWMGFVNDPDWKKAFAASRADGALVKKVQNCFMSSTDYSPMK